MASTLGTNEVEHIDDKSKIKTFDDVLIYIGAIGRYQKFLIFILLPFHCASAYLLYAQIFVTVIPEEHWCKVPEFENTNLTDWQKIELSVPSAKDDSSESRIPYSRCKMYITNYTDVLLTGKRPGNDTPIGDCMHGWSFNQSIIPYLSIAAELEWVCDKSYLSSTAQSIFFVGTIAGSLIFGYFADYYGRLPALVVCNGIGFLASVAMAFCNDFWLFAVTQFFVGVSFDNCTNLIFILVIEYIIPKYRTAVATVCFGVYVGFSSVIFPWIAYWISNWRILSVFAGFPLIVAFIAPWIIPESARWYVHKGRVKEALQVLKKFAKMNNKKVSPEIYEEIEKNFKNSIKSNDNYTLLHLMKLPRLRCISINLTLSWIIINLNYVSSIWNMQLLHPNLFISYSLSSTCEVLAAVIIAFLLDQWGRRWLSFFSMFICAIFSFVVCAVPAGVTAMWMAIIARLGVNVAINVHYQHAAELLPTVVRAQGTGFIHLSGFVISIFATHVIQLATIHPSFPFILLGSLSFVAAALTLALPETTNTKLPETLQEGNDFGRKQSFWCTNSSPEKVDEHERSVDIPEADSLLTISRRSNLPERTSFIPFPEGGAPTITITLAPIN